MENIEAFQNTHLNIFDIQKEYKNRQRQPAENGKKAKHRLESGELMLNPNPLLFHQELQRRIEVFENLKVTYLEQETKEKFLRGLLNDPPQLVEQSDLEQIRADNKDKKAALKQHKIKVADLESQLTEASRELCMDYENLQEKSSTAIQMMKEMEQMQQEIDELTRQQEALELPKHNDPDMNLPADELQALATEYDKQKADMEQALKGIKTSRPESENEQNQLQQEVQRLQHQSNTVQAEAQALVNQQKNQTQQQNESTAKWYRSMMSIIQQIHDIHNLTISNDNSVITFTTEGHDYNIHINNKNKNIIRASVSGVDQSTVDKYLHLPIDQFVHCTLS